MTEQEPEAPWRHTAPRSPFSTLDLYPLREDEARRLAAAYRGVDADRTERCVRAAEGNPLFLDQLLRLQDDQTVPGTVHSLVLARMDGLEPRDRRALQAASVIGPRFTVEALRELLDDPHYAHEPLVGRALVRPDDDVLLTSEGTALAFVHALVHEVVYASVVDETRERLHRRAAKVLAADDPELRAEHLDRAGDPRAAEAYLEAAGVRAGVYHHQRALELAERGLSRAVDDGSWFELACFRADRQREQKRFVPRRPRCIHTS